MNTTFNFWVNNRANARGTFDIYIRITQARKHKLVKTGITITKREDFNPKARQGNYIRGRNDSTKKLNDTLAIKLESLQSDMEALSKQSKNPSKESIIQKYRGESSHDFIAFLKRIIKRFNDTGSFWTAKRYNQLLNKLTAFESDSIPFDMITVTFLKDFEAYLTDLHQNTRYEHFKNIKAAFNQAIQEDIIPSSQNPFLRFKVKQVPTNKEKLTIKEIHALNKLKLDKGSVLNQARNCFMFSFYCGGIRTGDLLMMRWQNIVDGNLIYVMSKSRKSKLISRKVPLLQEAKRILKQYENNDSKPENFIFSELDNSLSKLISDDKKVSKAY